MTSKRFPDGEDVNNDNGKSAREYDVRVTGEALTSAFGVRAGYGPKFPCYVTADQREATFVGWPEGNSIGVADLVAAGFVYTNAGDGVRCHYCGTGLRNWLYGDDPAAEHARLSPTCQFMVMTKGLEYVKLCSAAFGGERVTNPDEVLKKRHEDKAEAARKERREDEEREKAAESRTRISDVFETLMSKEEVCGGYELEACEAAIAVFLLRLRRRTEAVNDGGDKKNDHNYRPSSSLPAYKRDDNRRPLPFTADQIEEILLEMKDENNREISSDLYTAGLEYTAEYTAAAMEEEKEEDSSSRRSLSSTLLDRAEATEPGTSSTDGIVRLLLRELSDSKKRESFLVKESESGRQLCLICEGRRADVANLPCAHVVTCSDCYPYRGRGEGPTKAEADCFEPCRVCGAAVLSVLRLYGTDKTFTN